MKRLLIVIGLAALIHGLWIPAKATLAQLLLRDAWRRTLAGDSAAKPWPWADTHPVARMIIDRTGSDFVVLAGSSGRTLAFGPGHLENTPLPGERGNCVISAHRDTQFAALRDLRNGDVVRVQRADGRWHAYAVEARRVVDRSDVWVTRSSDATTLTLVTCYPFDAVTAGGRERYVVLLSSRPCARTRTSACGPGSPSDRTSRS